MLVSQVLAGLEFVEGVRPPPRQSERHGERGVCARSRCSAVTAQVVRRLTWSSAYVPRAGAEGTAEQSRVWWGSRGSVRICWSLILMPAG